MNRPDLHTVIRWAPAVICCLLVACLLGGFAWYAGQTRSIVQATRDTQVNNTRLSQSTHANTVRLQAIAQAVIDGNNRIKDCIEPTGKCAQAAAANQADALRQVTAIVIAVQLCVLDPTNAKNPPAIQSCVDQLVKESGNGQPRR